MRRVLQALEQRAITTTKVEVDSLISEASQSIQAYVEDNDNLTELKRSVECLRRASNTLQIMQIHGGVLLADETIKVINMLLDGSVARAEEAQYVVSKSIIRLSEYLGHVEAGNKDIPLVLMPLLNDLRASRDEALLSENILFFPNVDGVTVPQGMLKSTEKVDSNWLRIIRINFQKTLLACVSGDDVPKAAAQLCRLSIRLQRASQFEESQKLWWLASVLSQAVAINALTFNVSIASLFNKLDKQIKLLVEIGESEFSKKADENIVKNILYYIAISDNRGRIVSQVKQSYRLNEQVPQQQDMAEIRRQLSAPSSGVLITVSKALLEDVASTKDCIELFIHSNFSEHKYIEHLDVGLQRISDTLSMIGIEEYRSKAEHQLREVGLLKSGEREDVKLVLLGVSEVILDIETCINNFIGYRINFQESTDSQKASNVRSETHHYDYEYKAAFSATISEVLLRIEQTKGMLTDVIHVAYDEGKTKQCVQNINDISGVVSVVDLTSSLSLINGVAGYIASDNFKRDVNEHNDELKYLADCMVGLQCYFEQWEDRAPYAEQILEHCKLSLERISRTDSAQQIEVIDVTAHQVDVNIGFDVTTMFADAELELNMDLSSDGLNREIDQLEEFYELSDSNGFTDQSVDAGDELLDRTIADEAIEHDSYVSNGSEVKVESESEKVRPKSGKKQQSSLAVLSGEADPILIEIFIEEAEQVVIDIKNNWNAWQSDQKDWDCFANMHRGYHTLKGSGRFVGAELLSELAWGGGTRIFVISA